VATAAPAGIGRADHSVARYVAGVAITVAAILSQYVVPERWPAARGLYGNLPGDLFVVYGIPIVAFSVLLGAGPLRHWAAHMGTAAVEGLGWYGALSLLALAITVALTVVYAVVDPGALALLDRPNPALTQAVGDPWFWIGFSFVVGAFEETIFRGWIYGFWQSRAASWVVPAIGSSVIFAGVHLYYGTTYGIAAPLIFPTLFFLGLAFAATYHVSGGNLVVVAVLHGAYDATGYATLINLDVGAALRYLTILAGAVIALVLYVRRSTPPVSFGPAP
jgi:membrane protease YdiL (CAAX protease family)